MTVERPVRVRLADERSHSRSARGRSERRASRTPYAYEDARVERTLCPDRQGSGGGFTSANRPPIAIDLHEPGPPLLACRGLEALRPRSIHIAIVGPMDGRSWTRCEAAKTQAFCVRVRFDANLRHAWTVHVVRECVPSSTIPVMRVEACIGDLASFDSAWTNLGVVER